MKEHDIGSEFELTPGELEAATGGAYPSPPPLGPIIPEGQDYIPADPILDKPNPNPKLTKEQQKQRNRLPWVH